MQVRASWGPYGLLTASLPASALVGSSPEPNGRGPAKSRSFDAARDDATQGMALHHMTPRHVALPKVTACLRARLGKTTRLGKTMRYCEDEVPVDLVLVPGIGMAHSNFFLRPLAATSSLVVVCGVNCAGSLHLVLLPGAAAESS